MGCRSYQRLLMCREDELTREEKERLAAHLTACAVCAREAEEAARMHDHLAAIRSVDVGGRDPEERVVRIVGAAVREERGPSRGDGAALLDRLIDLVATPVYRYASALALLVTVASGLWQAGTIAADVHQLELQQSRTSQEHPLLPTVEYAVEIDQQSAPLPPGFDRTPGVRIENGTVLLTGSTIEAARGIASSPAAMFTPAHLPRSDMNTMIERMTRTGVRIRPVLSFRNEKGV